MVRGLGIVFIIVGICLSVHNVMAVDFSQYLNIAGSVLIVFGLITLIGGGKLWR